jgi:anti-sigma factor RsiW
MNRQQLEFLISRHLDGDLSRDEQATLQAQLDRDPAARLMLAEYTALADVVSVGGGQVPDVDTAAFLAKLNASIDAGQVGTDFAPTHMRLAAVDDGADQEQHDEQTEQPEVIFSFKRQTAVWTKRIAIAAGLLIAFGGGMFVMNQRGGVGDLGQPGPVASNTNGTATVTVVSPGSEGVKVEPTVIVAIDRPAHPGPTGGGDDVALNNALGTPPPMRPGIYGMPLTATTKGVETTAPSTQPVRN